jgi:hypothetical protein
LLSVVLGLLVVVESGCSETKRPRRTASSSSSSKKSVGSRPLPKLGGSPTGGSTKLRNVSGPKTFDNLMVDAWKADLASPSSEKRIQAAKELANIGPSAKSALPALESMASDRNPQAAAAARDAISRIRK